MTCTPPEPPILAARECPPELLPKNALAFVAAAEENGWRTLARVAISNEGLASVVVYCGRGPVRVSASWSGQDLKKLGFASAWRMPGALGIPDKIGYRDALAQIKAKPVEQTLTASGVA